MNKESLDNVMIELERFKIKCEELYRATESTDKYCDSGVNQIGPSRTRAAVKRAALDLKYALERLRK